MFVRPCLLVAALLSTAAAQDPFKTPLLDAGYFPIWATTGDVNGDGRVDVVTANNQDIFVLLQVADGQFGAPQSQSQVDFIERIRLADLDEDGDLDLVGVVPSPFILKGLVVMLGAGDGSFGEPVFIDTAGGPVDLDLGDVDEDGHLDVAVAAAATTRLQVLLGHGDGTFAEPLDINAGGHPRTVDMGLVDGDTHLDIVFTRSDGVLITLLGAGNGSFTACAPHALGTVVSDLALGHVDSDAWADVFVAHDFMQARLLLGQGDGNFTIQPPIVLTSDSHRAVLADVDENGTDDALCLLTEAAFIPAVSGVAVMLSHGDGTLAPAQRYGTGSDPADLLVADLNHDGDLDVLAPFPVTFQPNSATLLEGHGNGRFGAVLLTGDGPEEMAFGDLDLDGDEELVVACGAGDTVVVHEALGHGELDAVGAAFAAGDFPVGIAVADAFEDGHPDVIVANRSNPGSVRTLIGDGAGGIVATAVTPTAFAPFGMGAADVDLDGSMDLALPSSDGKFHVLFGDGLGRFGHAIAVSAASISPDAVTFGDLDGDGLPELVGTTVGAMAVTVARNTGGGTFAAPLQVPVPHHNQHDVALGDLDGDTDLDIVSSGGIAGGLNVLKNNGNLTFSAGPVLSASMNWGVAIGDVTGDGIADILSACQGAPLSSAYGALVTWRGTGGGAFDAPQYDFIGPCEDDPVELTLHDVDGDGAQDALVSVMLDDDVWIFRNSTGPWTNVGQPLAGEQGLPRQRGFGAMHPGSPFEFLLTDARPSGTAWQVVGLSAINVPFKGGVYVPAPTFTTGPWPLDPAGDVSLAGNWFGPAAPGLQLWFQFWMQDPAAVKNWSASNALRLTLP